LGKGNNRLFLVAKDIQAVFLSSRLFTSSGGYFTSRSRIDAVLADKGECGQTG
jgi:hypothetical protein